MSYQAIVQLVSHQQSWGTSAPKKHRVNTGVASKLRALLKSQERKEASSSEEAKSEDTSQGEGSEKKSKGHKPYGTHSGQKHVDDLKKFTANSLKELGDLAGVYVSNVTAVFESQPSFDVKKKKKEHAEKMQQINDKYRSKYGLQLDQAASTALLKEKAQYEWSYTRHYIQIIIISDDYIDGARQNTDGQWTLTIKSKSIYSEDKVLIPVEKRQDWSAITAVSAQMIMTDMVFKPFYFEESMDRPGTYKLVAGYIGDNKYFSDDQFI